jgi:hypothetical protein
MKSFPMSVKLLAKSYNLEHKYRMLPSSKTIQKYDQKIVTDACVKMKRLQKYTSRDSSSGVSG